MKTVTDMIENLRKINVDREAKQAIARHGDDAVKLNIDQLVAGKTSKGDRIGRYRSALYARMKNSMNPTPGMFNVDLILTGRFINSFAFDLDSNALTIEADDPNDLLGKYGNDVIGLDKPNKETFSELVGETMVQQIATKL